MKSIRRKEKEIRDRNEVLAVLEEAKYVTIAMCKDNEPYLVTLSHGFEMARNCIYFHCAKEGKKIDILKENNLVWGQALLDKGYVEGACDHLYATAQFMGRVTFIDTVDEKKHALEFMIKARENGSRNKVEAQLTVKSVRRVQVGKIDIEFLSGKKSEEVIISI